MIVEGLLNLLFSAVHGVLGIFMSAVPAPPAWVAEALGYAGTVWSWVKAFDTWVPIDFAFVCGLFVVGCYAVSWSIMLGRMVLSYLTLGGGAT